MDNSVWHKQVSLLVHLRVGLVVAPALACVPEPVLGRRDGGCEPQAVFAAWPAVQGQAAQSQMQATDKHPSCSRGNQASVQLLWQRTSRRGHHHPRSRRSGRWPAPHRWGCRAGGAGGSGMLNMGEAKAGQQYVASAPSVRLAECWHRCSGKPAMHGSAAHPPVWMPVK